MFCLDVSNLYKNYGSLEAVRGVSFKVPYGVCFGLLGPNGAGKSTIIEILEDIKNPDKGSILFRGKPRSRDYKEQIGIQFQSTSLQDYMQVGEALHTFASFYKKPADVSEIAKLCRLTDIFYRDHRYLSGGQKKRLLLALSLINNPSLIFLDEPTTGLDPSSRKMFWDLIKDIKKEGCTIILTTHYMDEAYSLCDEMALINHGKIIEQGVPKELLSKHFQGVKVLFPLKYEKYFRSEKFPHSLTNTGLKIEFQPKDLQKFLKDILSKEIPLEDMEVSPYTLDDLFLNLTGETLRD